MNKNMVEQKSVLIKKNVSIMYPWELSGCFVG